MKKHLLVLLILSSCCNAADKLDHKKYLEDIETWDYKIVFTPDSVLVRSVSGRLMWMKLDSVPNWIKREKGL